MSKETSKRVLTVTELNRNVRVLLDAHYDWVWVEGELSNFSAPSSGHWYFILKDNTAQVRCAMFRNRNNRISQTPKNGEKIRVRGKVSLYEGRGDYQLVIEFLEAAGYGAMQAAFEQLKRKLQNEGIFAQKCKKSLPSSINNVCVITSITGAAIQDILQTLNRRSPSLEVYVFGVSVQGQAAAREICSAFKVIDSWIIKESINLDVIILARGGGSIEDLAAFNDENLARTIFNCKIPVISAVGHEIDISIADLVSDIRAATPTAAAELISPDQSILLNSLDKNASQMRKFIEARILNERTRTEYLKKRLRHPGKILQNQSQKLDQLEHALIKLIKRTIKLNDLLLINGREKLFSGSPLKKIHLLKKELENKSTNLCRSIKQQLATSASQIAHLEEILEATSPKRVLDRGYAVLTLESGKTIKKRSDAESGANIIAHMSLGKLKLKACRWIDKAEN